MYFHKPPLEKIYNFFPWKQCACGLSWNGINEGIKVGVMGECQLCGGYTLLYPFNLHHMTAKSYCSWALKPLLL